MEISLKKLNKRQEHILAFLENSEKASAGELVEVVARETEPVTRMTVLRDVDELLEQGFVKRVGSGRSAAYCLAPMYARLRPMDVDAYFSRPFGERRARAECDGEVFALLASENILSQEEQAYLEKKNKKYAQTKRTLEEESPAILKREWERLIIEFSWKSSEIEGNTYSLLETEALLKESQYAEGKDRAEAQMILNHKNTFEYILANREMFSEASSENIKKLHEMLVEGLGVKMDFRNHPVGITGTLYRPPAKEKHIEELMSRMLDAVRAKEDPFEAALILLVGISYLQPFEDGNKRTARMMANAFLHAHDRAMLSYRSVPAVEYKKAMLLFYEQNNLSAIKKIFIEQFAFSTEHYFG